MCDGPRVYGVAALYRRIVCSREAWSDGDTTAKHHPSRPGTRHRRLAGTTTGCFVDRGVHQSDVNSVMAGP